MCWVLFSEEWIRLQAERVAKEAVAAYHLQWKIHVWNAFRSLLNDEVLSRWSWVWVEGTEGFADASSRNSSKRSSCSSTSFAMEINAWNAFRSLLNEEVLSRWSWVLGGRYWGFCWCQTNGKLKCCCNISRMTHVQYSKLSGLNPPSKLDRCNWFKTKIRYFGTQVYVCQCM